MSTKGWTQERREAQRQRCLANPPSKFSTGPKTPAGKARSSMNAFKHGGDTQYKKMIRNMLGHNREFLKTAAQLGEIEVKKAMEKQLRIAAQLRKMMKTK